VLDSCEFLVAPSLDCDSNGVLDACEISTSPGLDWNSNAVLDECEAIESSYCTANDNSTGLPTRLRVLGSTIASSNEVELLGDQLPTNEFGFFLLGMNAGNVSIGQGMLCLSNPIVRLDVGPGAIQNSGPSGVILRSIDLLDLPQSTTIQAGETWRFQLWHRDFDVVNGVNSMNFSDGVEVLFQ
jgi:hypothetical protein